MSVEFYRGSPGKFDSRTLSRETLSRWTGRRAISMVNTTNSNNNNDNDDNDSSNDRSRNSNDSNNNDNNNSNDNTSKVLYGNLTIISPTILSFQKRP